MSAARPSNSHASSDAAATTASATRTSSHRSTDPAAAVGSGYRADIDGLRAVAVLSVAFYHADTPGFSGGFVGVDIFFVISGYLITRIIAADVALGRFSIVDFYERRARRILPALFAVATAVVLFTLLYRSPRDADIFGESVTLFAVFAANFFFYDQLDYFSDPAELYPLLHMWSLAVEEQFYLVFPPLFVALWAWLGGRSWIALSALAAASFVAAAVVVRFDPQLAFFHTPFRMWELLAGGLLALRENVLTRVLARPWRREAAAVGGMALLGAPIFLYDQTTLFPGLSAAPPVLGAVLVIAAGAAGPTVVSRALSWRPAVFVGLVSYSFYLWHWPALSAARYASDGPLALSTALLLLAGAFLVSVASLFFIERPFRRRGGVASRRGVFAASAAGIVALLLVGWGLQESKGWPGRYPDLAPLFAEDSRRYGPAPTQCVDAGEVLGAQAAALLDPRSCVVGDRGRIGAALWGDSHMWAWAAGLGPLLAEEGGGVLVAWSAICPPVRGYDRPVATRFHDCGASNEGALAAIASAGVGEAFLAARWGFYDFDARFEAQLRETLRALRRAGVAATIIGALPERDAHPPNVLFRAGVLGRDHGLDLPRAVALAQVGATDARLEAIARDEGAAFLSSIDLTCGEQTCPISSAGGAPLFSDAHHLSRIGARWAAERAREAIAAIRAAALSGDDARR